MSIPVSAPTSYHGIVTTVSGVSGLYQTASAATASNKVIALDNNGNAKNVEIFDFVNTLTLDVTYPTGTPTAAVGDVVTVASFKNDSFNGAYLVETMSETQSNVDFTKYNMTATRYLQNAIPAASV